MISEYLRLNWHRKRHLLLFCLGILISTMVVLSPVLASLLFLFFLVFSSLASIEIFTALVGFVSFKLLLCYIMIG